MFIVPCDRPFKSGFCAKAFLLLRSGYLSQSSEICLSTDSNFQRICGFPKIQVNRKTDELLFSGSIIVTDSSVCWLQQSHTESWGPEVPVLITHRGLTKTSCLIPSGHDDERGSPVLNLSQDIAIFSISLY